MSQRSLILLRPELHFILAPETRDPTGWKIIASNSLISTQLIPFSSAAFIKEGKRVKCMLENGTPYPIGNTPLSSSAARARRSGDASSQFLVASLAALYKEQARMSLCAVAQQKRICKREPSGEL